jgi:hypothetical protein
MALKQSFIEKYNGAAKEQQSEVKQGKSKLFLYLTCRR